MSLDYSGFDIRLVVDVVEIEIETTQPTQANHIFKRLNGQVSHICGCNSQTRQPYSKEMRNTTTNVFRITIQEPKRFSDIDRLFAGNEDFLHAEENGFRKSAYVYQKSTLKNAPVLTKIEVALDIYSKGAGEKELSDIAADLYRFSTNQPKTGWYFYRKAGEGRKFISEDDSDKALTRNEIAHLFCEGWQLTDCDKNKLPPVRMHLYVKTTDSGGVGLDQCDWRARAEVTLQGAALPCQTVEELKALDFASLTDHFKFRMLSGKLHPAAARALDRFSGRQLGRAGAYPRKSRNRVGHHSQGRMDAYRASTQANDHLNRRVIHEELRGLTRAWRKSPKGELTQFRGNFEAPNQGFMRLSGQRLTIASPHILPTQQESTQADEHEGKQRLPSPSPSLPIVQSQKSAAPAEPAAPKSAARTCLHGVVDDFMHDFDAAPGLASELQRVADMMPSL